MKRPCSGSGLGTSTVSAGGLAPVDENAAVGRVFGPVADFLSIAWSEALQMLSTPAGEWSPASTAMPLSRARRELRSSSARVVAVRQGGLGSWSRRGCPKTRDRSSEIPKTGRASTSDLVMARIAVAKAEVRPRQAELEVRMLLATQPPPRLPADEALASKPRKYPEATGVRDIRHCRADNHPIARARSPTHERPDAQTAGPARSERRRCDRPTRTRLGGESARRRNGDRTGQRR